LVVGERAAKAKCVLALASDGGYDSLQIALLDTALDSVHAVRRRTPLKILLVVHVRPHQELVIALSQVGSQEQVERFRIDDLVAAVARTLYPRGFAFILDLLGKILPVAVDAEAVFALHGKCLQPWPILAADVAHEVVLDLYPRWTGLHVMTETCLVQHLFLIVHVLLDEPFLVPSHVS